MKQKREKKTKEPKIDLPGYGGVPEDDDHDCHLDIYGMGHCDHWSHPQTDDPEIGGHIEDPYFDGE